MNRGEREKIESILRDQEFVNQVLLDAEALAEQWECLTLVDRSAKRSGIISRALNLGVNEIEAIRGFFAEKKICTKTAFNKALKEARLARDGRAEDAPKEATPEEIAKEKAQLRDEAAPLILCEHILPEVVKMARQLGLAGEERNAQILYLIHTSRVLKKPCNAIIKGPSAGGKSYTEEKVLQLFPPSSYCQFTAMSEKALAFFDEDMSHKVLVLFEVAGISKSENGQYMIRSLISEGCIKYLVPQKIVLEGGETIIRSVEKKLEGPTGFIATTARAGIDRELETRLLALEVDDTDQHTRAILIAQAQIGNERAEPDLTAWHAFQRLLELEKPEVEIPFAVELAKACIPKGIRLRRDFPQLLQLVKAHAIFHLYQRERTRGGRIIASMDDYAAVYDLVADLVAEGAQTTVSDAIRETVEAVKELLHTINEVRITHVARALGISKQAAQQRVYKAIYGGWLVNQENRKGRPAILALGDPLPEETGILPTPPELKSICHDSGLTALPEERSSLNSSTYRSASPQTRQVDRLTTEDGDGNGRSIGQLGVNDPCLTHISPKPLEKSTTVKPSTQKSDEHVFEDLWEVNI